MSFYPLLAGEDLTKYDRTYPSFSIDSMNIDLDGGVSTLWLYVYNTKYDYEGELCYMEAVLDEDNKPVNGFDVKETPEGYSEGPYGEVFCSFVGMNIPYDQEDNSINIDGTKYTLHSEDDMMNSWESQPYQETLYFYPLVKGEDVTNYWSVYP